MLLAIARSRRILFVGGKGGVGKTSVSAALAVARARDGGRVLLVSTDPAHNLGHIWDRELSDEPVRVLTTDDLVQGEDVFVAATGVTSGALLRGVRVVGDHVETESVVMRSRSGTVRRITATHPLSKIQSLMKGAR